MFLRDLWDVSLNEDLIETSQRHASCQLGWQEFAGLRTKHICLVDDDDENKETKGTKKHVIKQKHKF